MLRSLICNKALKKVCCPNLDKSESEDVLNSESRSSITESDKNESSVTETSVYKEGSERKSEDKDKVVTAENDENVEYLKNLTSRYVMHLFLLINF